VDRRFALALAVVAALPAAALADDGPKVRIESVGGSRLIGTWKVKSIAIQADFGKVEVDPSKIKSLTLGDRDRDRDGDTIVTTSGSIIKGKISDDAFEIESEFGTIKLERSKLRSLTLAKDATPGDPPLSPAGDQDRKNSDPPGTDPKAGSKEATAEGRGDRPRPIPRFLTQPSALKVTKISAGRPPRCVLPPIPKPPPIQLKTWLDASSPMNLRTIKP